tara:strand:+ start:1255 stop:3354 length:2100 start_codon:yes stop_codon:yes gene_type:complete
LADGITEDGLIRAMDSFFKKSNATGNSGSRGSIDVTGPLGAFKDAVNNSGGSLTAFSKGVTSSVKGLGILGKALGGVTAVVGYLEDTQAEFNKLSKVGAGLNGNLSDLRVSAARTRLPLDKFSALISDNVTELAGFAGGVEGGTRKVAALGKELFATQENGTQLIEGFMNLGYSIQEANEFVVRNTAAMRRRQLVEGLTDAQSVQAAQELAKQMDIVSKLTGKDAKSQMDDMTARMRNGSTDSKLRLLEKQGVTTARAAYEKSTAALQKSPAVVRDLLADLVQTGAPMTAVTRNFMALNDEAASLLTKSANATKAGDIEGAQRYAEDAARATVKSADSVQNLTIGTYGQINEIAQAQANVLQEVAPIIDAVAAHTKKMESTLMRTVTFTEAFNNMLGSIVNPQGNQVAGKGAGQEALVALNKSQQALADTASAINEALAKELNNSLVVGALNGLTEQMKKINPESLAEIVKTAAAMLPGASNAELAREAATIGAVSAADSALFTEMEAATTSQARKDEIKADLQSRGILNAEGTIDVRIVEDLSASRRAIAAENPLSAASNGSSSGFLSRIFGGGKEYGGSVQSGKVYEVNENTPNSELFAPGMSGAVIPNMKTVLNKIGPMLSSMQSEISQNGAPMAQIAAAMSGSRSSGASTEELLQTTNDLLSAMLGVNTEQKRNSEKQYKHTRSAGNLMNGFGRA